MLRRHWRGVAALFGLAFGTGYGVFRLEMRGLRARLEVQSSVVETSHGAVEYAEGGAGPVVLALHGAGGGFDQGRLMAQAFGGAGVRWIAPSRFGYLRSTLPEDASTTAQADALVELLDALEVERVGLLAMSGGGPPALQLAARHPERVSAMVLLSLAPFTPTTGEAQDTPAPIWVYDLLFRSDLPYWVLSKTARGALGRAFGVEPPHRARAPQRDLAFVDEMVATFLPVTARADGVRNEGAAIDPETVTPLDLVQAPTLIIHARDDRLAPFTSAELAKAGIRHSELVAFETGGHLLLGHHAEVARRVAAFWAANR